MAFPTVTFNSSTGSDTLASGAGPATAKTGVLCAVTNASASVAITDVVDLSGVATDGSACLWVATASGRQFSRITAVAGSSGAWTLTVDDTVWTSGTGLSWAIGGKRASFDAASSRTLFGASGPTGGWTVKSENAVESIATVLNCSQVLNLATGRMKIQGQNATARTTLRQTANANHINATTDGYDWIDFVFDCTFATKNAVLSVNGTLPTWNFTNCVLGDATNKVLNGTIRTSGSATLTWTNCDIRYTTGVGLSGNSITHRLSGTIIHDCTSHGITCNVTPIISSSAIYANGGSGIVPSALGTNSLIVRDSIIHGNANDGITSTTVATAMQGAIITGNQITGNGGWGINAIANSNNYVSQVQYNNFGVSGNYPNALGTAQNVTLDSTNLSVIPGYANAGATPPDFTPGSAVLNKGFPDSTLNIGANNGGSKTFKAIGAIQPQAAAPSAGMRGGFSN